MKKTAQLNQTSLYNDAELRMKEVMAAKEFMQKFISTAPEGKIHIIRKNQAIQYYNAYHDFHNQLQTVVF